MRSVILTLVLLLSPSLALAQSCPAPLAGARKLVLVTPDTMTSTTATLQRFTRAGANAPWHADGGPATAMIGRKGTAWSHAFRAYAASGEPVKVDGDKRVPAGIYPIGRSFGFGPSRLPGYMRIGDGMTCVDDPSSPAYNTITSRERVGWKVHGENMWRVPEYRRGLVVDYPTNRAAKAGSCIFIHVRKPGATGTSGCVSLPEGDVEGLQHFASDGAVLAVVPKQALGRFAGCLPN
jgi:L,D-peptidoglycan transpeptidase YkuD (ErfK/YbiS/YcfS/YnhG family)